MFRHPGTHPQILLKNQKQQRRKKWEWENTTLRTKITRVLAGNALVMPYLGQKKFGDMITADHKVLSEGCESRHSHRHAVVVQDLASRWMDFRHIRAE